MTASRHSRATATSVAATATSVAATGTSVAPGARASSGVRTGDGPPETRAIRGARTQP
jgi:hypothetical protein